MLTIKQSGRVCVRKKERMMENGQPNKNVGSREVTKDPSEGDVKVSGMKASGQDETTETENRPVQDVDLLPRVVFMRSPTSAGRKSHRRGSAGTNTTAPIALLTDVAAADKPKAKPLTAACLKLARRQLSPEALDALAIPFRLEPDATVADYLAAALASNALLGDSAAMKQFRDLTEGRTPMIQVQDEPEQSPDEKCDEIRRKVINGIADLMIGRTRAFPSKASPINQLVNGPDAEAPEPYLGKKSRWPG